MSLQEKMRQLKVYKQYLKIKLKQFRTLSNKRNSLDIIKKLNLEMKQLRFNKHFKKNMMYLRVNKAMSQKKLLK